MSNNESADPSEDGLELIDAAEMAPLPRKRADNGFVMPLGKSMTSSERKKMFVCYLAARALTSEQIADEVGVSAARVRDILRDPDAQAFVAEQMAVNCAGGIEKRIKEDAIYAQQKLRKLLDDAIGQNKLDVARKLIKDMTDRYFGTPTSRVEHTQIDPDKMSDAELIRIATSGAVNPQS